MSCPLRIAFLVVDDRFKNIEQVPRFGAAPSALLRGFEQLQNELEIHVISCTMGKQTAPEKLAPNIWFHGLAVPKSGYLRTLHSGCIRAVRRIIREIQPDVIHAQGTERWCAVAGIFNRLPKVLTIHGNLEVIDPLMKMRPRPYWMIQTLLQKLTLPRYDGVFCNSDYTLECLRRKAKHVWNVPNPLRGEFFQPNTANPAPLDPPIIINIGVFQARKRQLRLLELARDLWNSGTRVRFRFFGVLGEDDYSRQCRDLLNDGQKTGFAEYAGTRTAQELVEEMDRAHAMIHCPEEEAFGLVVGEALARGLKFFGTEVGGIVDITRGTNGADLHEMNDWDGISTSIRSWIASGSPRHPENMHLMRMRYSPEVIALRHLEIYRELTQKNTES